MPTLAVIRGYLQDELGTDNNRYPSATRDRHINEAIKELSDELEVSWDTASSTWNTSSGVDTYAFSGLVDPELKVPTHLSIVLDDGECLLRARTLSEIRDTFPSSSTDPSVPVFYAIWAESIILGPTPNGIYQVRMDYRSAPPVLVADDDSNGWSVNAATVVLRKASIKGARFLMDFELISEFSRDLERLIENLMLDQAERNKVRIPVMELPA